MALPRYFQSPSPTANETGLRETVAKSVMQQLNMRYNKLNQDKSIRLTQLSLTNKALP